MTGVIINASPSIRQKKVIQQLLKPKTNDKTTLFGSEFEADGPIPIANNQYSFEITGTTSTTCSGSNAVTFTATATNKRDDSEVFSISNTLKKTGF